MRAVSRGHTQAVTTPQAEREEQLEQVRAALRPVYRAISLRRPQARGLGGKVGSRPSVRLRFITFCTPCETRTPFRRWPAVRWQASYTTVGLFGAALLHAPLMRSVAHACRRIF